MTISLEQANQFRTQAGLKPLSALPTPPSPSDAPANDIISQRKAALGLDQPQTQTTPSFGSRVKADITNAGNEVESAISGEGKYATESPIRRGVEATASAMGAPLKVASEALPEPVHAGLGKVGEATSGVINWLGDKIGSTQLAQDFVTKHPEAAKTLEEIAGTGAAAGSISNDILAEGGTATAAQKVADTVPLATEKVANAVESAKGAVGNKIDQIRGATPSNQASFVKDLVTPEVTKKGLTTAIKTGKVSEGSGLLGDRDITGAVPNIDKIQESVSKVPGVSSKNTMLENVNAIHDEIGKVANDLKAQLKGKGFFSPNEFKGYMKSIKSELADNPLIVGDAEKTADKIINKFSSLVSEKGHTPEGLLEARKSLDSWMASQKGNVVFDPAKENAISIALRSIRQGGNNFLAERVPDVAVKDMLEHQSNLYRAIENIAPKAAKEGNNALQQFFRSHPVASHLIKRGVTAGVGALAGSTIGGTPGEVAGGTAGAIIGGAI